VRRLFRQLPTAYCLLPTDFSMPTVGLDCDFTLQHAGVNGGVAVGFVLRPDTRRGGTLKIERSVYLQADGTYTPRFKISGQLWFSDTAKNPNGTVHTPGRDAMYALYQAFLAAHTGITLTCSGGTFTGLHATMQTSFEYLGRRRWDISMILNNGNYLEFTQLVGPWGVPYASALLYRYGGYSATTISSIWLEVSSPGASPLTIFPTANKSVGIAARIRVPAAADVGRGDILKPAGTTRYFLVQQMIPASDAQVCLCSEILPPLPDEFDYQAGPETFWSYSGPFFANNPAGAGLMRCDPNPTTVAGASAWLYQTLPGGPRGNDFDIWCKVSVPVGGAGVTYYGLLGARKFGSDLVDNLGVWVTLYGNGTLQTARIDQYGNNTQNLGAAGPNASYLRIRRTSTTFYCYYSASTSDPVDDSEWVELAQPANLTLLDLTQDLRVGVGGYRVGGVGFNYINFSFFRNWVMKRNY